MGESRRIPKMKALTKQTNELAMALLTDVNDAYSSGATTDFYHALERFEKGAKGLEAIANYIEITRINEG
jgi:hypothetical protein